MCDLMFRSDDRTITPVLSTLPFHDATRLTEGGSLAQIALDGQVLSLIHI